jgi:hypothetical protein
VVQEPVLTSHSRSAASLFAVGKGWHMSCLATNQGHDVRIEAPAGHWGEFQPLGVEALSSV